MLNRYPTSGGIIILLLNLLMALPAQAQVDTVRAANEDDDIDYSSFADATEVKRYATQKVLNQSPARLITAAYEWHGPHTITSVANTPLSEGSQSNRIPQAAGPRLAANFPVWSTDKAIVNLGAQYWGTFYNIDGGNVGAAPWPAAYLNDNMLHSAGVFVTLFKPLNQTNFLILQAGADANSALPSGAGLKSKAFTFSASAIYGWKLSEKNMWGVGLSRTYRMGRLINVPVLYWNKTFNDRWGTEILLPARAHVRRNFNPASLLMIGYELEGNQYLLPGLRHPLSGNQPEHAFLQRGEIKPRLQWDRQLKDFIWLSVQAGARINGRFAITNRYYGKEEHEFVFNKVAAAPYFNLSLNLVSP